MISFVRHLYLWNPASHIYMYYNMHYLKYTYLRYFKELSYSFYKLA